MLEFLFMWLKLCLSTTDLNGAATPPRLAESDLNGGETPPPPR